MQIRRHAKYPANPQVICIFGLFRWVQLLWNCNRVYCPVADRVKINRLSTHSGLSKSIMKKLSILLAIWVLTACSGNLFTVHKIDIQQGNALKQEYVKQLKIGMEPEQVSLLLGNPMVNNLFHPDRWYYVFYFKPGSGQLVERRLTIHFNDGLVSRIEYPPQSTKLASGSEAGA